MRFVFLGLAVVGLIISIVGIIKKDKIAGFLTAHWGLMIVFIVLYPGGFAPSNANIMRNFVVPFVLFFSEGFLIGWFMFIGAKQENENRKLIIAGIVMILVCQAAALSPIFYVPISTTVVNWLVVVSFILTNALGAYLLAIKIRRQNKT